MADCIVNRLTIIGEASEIKQILNAIKGKGSFGTVDFNVILPSPDDWGSDGNAYCIHLEGENTLYFNTSGCAPYFIIESISKMFPNCIIEHLWASDDIGNDQGEICYKGGKIIEEYLPQNGSREAYSLFYEVRNIHK